ncbi:MAG TPA: AMP-binding protein [Thermotogota bacterium]|nr:AMP-binding protein [Thermotogota bacterium]
MTTIDRFEETVRNYGDKTAIIDNQGEHTFSELRTRAIQFGATIEKKANRTTNKPVAVCLNEGFDFVAAMLGVLYSGNFYVPVIKEFPVYKIGKILKTIDPVLILTDLDKTMLFIKNGLSVSTLLIDEEIETDAKDIQDVSGYKRIIDVDPVYIVHTSGSTGDPKGVIISHRALHDHILQLNRRFKINSEAIISCRNYFCYDAIVPEIYPMVFYGAQAVIMRPEKKKTTGNSVHDSYAETIQGIISELNKYRVNTLFYTTPLIKLIANEDGLREEKPLYLKRVQFGGDVMPVKLLNYWRRHLPDVEYSNVYGPTETTDVCSYYIADGKLPEEAMMPAGKAFDNREILIVSKEGKRILPGETGEVYIRGVSVGIGYWNKKEKSAESYVQNPLHNNYRDICYRTGDHATCDESGNILFIGRKDSQVKYQGNRVELGEIEAAALSKPGIKNCCVFFDEEKEKLILFYEAEIETEKLAFMQYLHERLQVIPAEYLRIVEFPRLSNGKIDRQSLFKRLSI